MLLLLFWLFWLLCNPYPEHHYQCFQLHHLHLTPLNPVQCPVPSHTMPHLNSKPSERSCGPLVPNPYSVFSQLASSPYASLHPLALKRLFEEEYYFKSLFGAAFKGEHADLFQHTKVNLARQNSLLNSPSASSLATCSSSPSPTLPSALFSPPHIDTNNNTIPTSKFCQNLQNFLLKTSKRLQMLPHQQLVTNF